MNMSKGSRADIEPPEGASPLRTSPGDATISRGGQVKSPHPCTKPVETDRELRKNAMKKLLTKCAKRVVAGTVGAAMFATSAIATPNATKIAAESLSYKAATYGMADAANSAPVSPEMVSQSGVTKIVVKNLSGILNLPDLPGLPSCKASPGKLKIICYTVSGAVWLVIEFVTSELFRYAVCTLIDGKNCWPPTPPRF